MTAMQLGKLLGLDTSLVDAALSALEGEGFVLRGTFTPASTDVEWCERGPPGADSPLHPQPAAERNRGGHGGGLLSVPTPLASRCARTPGWKDLKAWPRSSSNSRAWKRERRRGRLTFCRSEWKATTRVGSISCASPAESPGAAALRPRAEHRAPSVRVRSHFRVGSTRAPGASALRPMSRRRAAPPSPSTCFRDPAQASSTTSFARRVCSQRKPKRPSASSSPSAW